MARELALTYSEATEQAHFEKTSFRVKKKIFATLDTEMKRIVVKLSEVDQSAFGTFDHSVIYPVSGSWGRQGWTIVELDKVSKEILKDILDTSYYLVAQKKPDMNVTD